MSENLDYAMAVNKIQAALSRAKSLEIPKKMEHWKKDVRQDFRDVFAPERIENLSGEDFRGFLKPTKNKHWSGLSRSAYSAADEERMPDLRRALAILLNEKREPSIAKRLDEARSMIKSVGKAVLTAILQVEYPDRYGVWNARSEQGLKRLGLWPQFERGSTFGKQYEIINSRLLKLVASVGDIDLWILDALWSYLEDSVAEAATSAAEVEQDKEEGYHSNPKIRRAIENQAMKVAQEEYRREQYEVDPGKHRTESYDMECRKDGRTLHVEVKGTQGSGERIILTAREIEHAETHPMELCVVRGIQVNEGQASGGTPTVYPNWNPRGKYKLECIAYKCTLPKQT